jgi:superoxide dismutase, Cu-Zn family
MGFTCKIFALASSCNIFNRHEFANFENGCLSAGPHYNPHGNVHGGRCDEVSLDLSAHLI